MRWGCSFRSRTMVQPLDSSSGASMCFTVRPFQSPPQLVTTICLLCAYAGRIPSMPAPATASPAPTNSLRFMVPSVK